MEIEIGKRVVTDVATLFGDIGGISSFFLAFIGLFVGYIPSMLFQISKAEALFHTNIKKKTQVPKNKMQQSK